MKKFANYLAVIIIMASYPISGVFSQSVGINTKNPDPSSVLDISSSSKGILIPRVSIDNLTSPDPISDPVEGLLVYNISNVTSHGFYYWKANGWNEVIVPSRSFSTAQYAELYEAHDVGLYGDIISISQGSWAGWKTASQGISVGGFVMDTTDIVADRISIGESGLYQVDISVSYIGESNNRDIIGSLFVNGNRQAKVSFHEKIGANDSGSNSAAGLINLAHGDYVDLRFTSTNNNGAQIRPETINLRLTKIAEF